MQFRHCPGADLHQEAIINFARKAFLSLARGIMTEEKPKRRTRKKKDEEAEAEKGSAEEKPADTEADDKPKKKGWWSR